MLKDVGMSVPSIKRTSAVYIQVAFGTDLDILMKMFSLLCVNVHVHVCAGFWYAYNTGQELCLFYKARVYSGSTYFTPLLCVTCTVLTDCVVSVGPHVEWRNTDCQVLSLTATGTTGCVL